jgi:hypothetical protein
MRLFAGKRPRSRSISPRQLLSCCRNSFPATDTGRFNRKTTSQGKHRAIIKRNASLAWRFMAFRRFAARASRFGTINPNRGAARIFRCEHMQVEAIAAKHLAR